MIDDKEIICCEELIKYYGDEPLKEVAKMNYCQFCGRKMELKERDNND